LSTYLLDVNVLLALADPAHVHYDRARHWFREGGRNAWATCPITENGFLKILSYPRYPNSPGDVSVVADILERLREASEHVFWPDDVSVLEILEPNAVIATSQITDADLLGLAAHKGGKLATLDGRLNASAVRGGREALHVISA